MKKQDTKEEEEPTVEHEAAEEAVEPEQDGFAAKRARTEPPKKAKKAKRASE